LPMPKAAPNATSAATTPMIAARERVIRGTCPACGAWSSRDSCS
jgi:hypothetical protein